MSDGVPPQYDPQGSGAPAPQPPMQPSDERLWTTLVDVGGIFFGFVPALIAYLVLKDRSDFVRRTAAGAFNFQITILIGYVAGSILSIVVVGLLLLLAAGIVNLIFSILAAVAANRGQDYRYPMQIPIFR